MSDFKAGVPTPTNGMESGLQEGEQVIAVAERGRVRLSVRQMPLFENEDEVLTELVIDSQSPSGIWWETRRLDGEQAGDLRILLDEVMSTAFGIYLRGTAAQEKK